MKKQELVSIITPVYECEKFIEETIKSVLAQTYNNYEYIIVDGNSDDRTMEIINKYRENIDKLICEPDYGISDAFNKGIKNACGDLIGIMNAGDIFFDENVLKQIANCYTPECEIMQGSQILKNFETGFEYGLKPSLKYGHIYSLVRFYPNHMATYISKRIYQKYGYYRLNYKICMDVELLYRYHRNGIKVSIMDLNVGYFRLGGLSDSKEFQQMQEKLAILREDNGNPVEILLCAALLMLKIIFRGIARNTCGIDTVRRVGCKNLTSSVKEEY